MQRLFVYLIHYISTISTVFFNNLINFTCLEIIDLVLIVINLVE